MTSYMDEDQDELMPRRSSANNNNNNSIYHPIKSTNTMNTRAPTNLHTRLTTSLDAPHDEDFQPPPIVSPSKNANANATSRNTNLNLSMDSDDHESFEYVNKKKKMRDRPWKKAEEYDALSLQADDMDIIGVGMGGGGSTTSSRSASPKTRMVSPANSDGQANGHGHGNAGDDDDDDLSYENEQNNSLINNIHHDDDLSLSSRWSQNPSSPEEVKDAHVRAIGLAAKRAAERDLARDELPYPEAEDGGRGGRRGGGGEELELPYPEESNHSSASNSNRSTPTKSPNSRAADHHRVRMEALKMLELADRKGEDGGYIVKGGPETPLTTTTTSGSSNSNSASSKVTHSVGHKLKQLREKTSLRKLRTPRYERLSLSFHKDDDDDDFEMNPHLPPPSSTKNDNTPIGKLHDIDLPYPDHHPSPNVNGNGSDNATSKSWGSRYSIDRHMLAVNGGLTSAQVLDKMDQDHYDNLNKNTSANNMFKTSPHEDESRWNVRQGMSTDQDTIGRGRKMWNTFVMNVKDTVDNLYTKVSTRVDDGKHTTLGSHRSADHSSPRQGVFTGVAMTKFLDRLSPKSREAHINGGEGGGGGSGRKRGGGFGGGSFNWNSINLVDRQNNQDLPNVEFTAHDDYVIEKRQRRRRFLWMILLFLTLVAVMCVTLATTRSRSGTIHAMYYDVGEEIKFWVMSDIPYNKAEETLLSRELTELHARDGDFLVHLGDIHQAQVTLCPFSVYDDAAHLLKQSPVPVIVLPGNNDWNECPMPEISFDYWMEKLNRFEDNFPVDDYASVPAVNRQLGRDENFAFLQKGVLFIGLNLVDGKVQDEREWLIRHQTNVQWVELQLSMYNVDEYRAIVLMGHAGYTAKVGDFFWPVTDDLKSTNKPVLYLHASDGQGMIEYNPVDDFPKFTAVRLEKGSRVTPTLVTVLAGPRPFRFHVDIEENN